MNRRPLAFSEPITPRADRLRRMDLLWAAAFSLFFTVSAFYLIPQSEHNPVQAYVTMARSPFSFFVFPYGTRILTPLIVHYLPWEDYDMGFRCLAEACFFLSGFFLYLLVRLFGLHPLLIFGLLPAFYFAPTARFIIAHPWYVDPLSYALLLLFFLGLLMSNPAVVTLALTAGAFNRPESLLLLPVLLAAWWDPKRPAQTLKKVFLCSAAGIVIALLFRFLWPHITDFALMPQLTGAAANPNSESPAKVFEEQGGVRVLWDIRVYREMMPYLWGIALVGLLHASWRLTFPALLYIALTAGTMLVASDFYRLPFFAFPSVMLLSGVGLAVLSRIHVALAAGCLALAWVQIAWFPFHVWLPLLEGILLVGCLLYLSRQTDSTNPF